MRSFIVWMGICMMGVINAYSWASDCAPDCAADCAQCASDGNSCCSGVCSLCGCCSGTRKVCRVVEDVKKTPKTSYSCECKDFCIPGKSEFCGYKCECGPCCTGKCKKVWKPTCGEARTKRVLIKTVKQKEEKTHKYEVIEVCAACACNGLCLPCGSANGACGADCGSVPCAQATSEATTELASQPTPPAEETVQESNDSDIPNPPTPVETVSLVRRLVRKSNK